MCIIFTVRNISYPLSNSIDSIDIAFPKGLYIETRKHKVVAFVRLWFNK